ncbi:hypothetical protein JCM9140_888 [Halalkalibacter wakoensis JCM 9140]|uniref:Uncharacterized protein n=1 Tax=Halalkalibacter wakoensis JCM 9140 TaxID=1236970 RepID=W4PZR6_9BACI|nr:hypothetical protein [Halalkalibacter wakoensis]GAE24923.1 hypothetical protein JCM9140_888 [Halalkalibacter wakoensis JCM 9140]
MSYRQYWDEIYQTTDEVNALIHAFWSEYSHMGTWQFWVSLSFLILPLVLLVFTVDRKRIFEVFFFGYTVHMLWTYTSLPLERYGYFTHTYFITPLLPFALNVTSSALPVGFLLLYQYCTNNKKNFYLFTLLLSAIFAFGFATFEEFLGLVEFRKGTNQLHLFLIDVIIAYMAYWFTKILLKVKSQVD